MVCDDNAGSECSQVLRDVWQFLDNEMDEEKRAVVQQHLDDCSPCLEEAGIDLKLKALLHRKCGGDRAPQQLRERLVARLSQMRVTAGGVETDRIEIDTLEIRMTQK